MGGVHLHSKTARATHLMPLPGLRTGYPLRPCAPLADFLTLLLTIGSPPEALEHFSSSLLGPQPRSRPTAQRSPPQRPRWTRSPAQPPPQWPSSTSCWPVTQPRGGVSLRLVSREPLLCSCGVVQHRNTRGSSVHHTACRKGLAFPAIALGWREAEKMIGHASGG